MPTTSYCMHMKYFVTGGAGFIGSHLVDLLMSKPQAETEIVTVYDKLTYAGNLKNLEKWKADKRLIFLKQDICDKVALRNALPGHDVIIHLAAESHVDRSINSAEPFVKTNVLGTLNVLEAALLSNVQTMIQVSTDEVYGSISEGSANENSLLLPNSPYAASKASSDLIARSFFQTHGLDVRVTRCCNNYGAHQYPEKFIPVAINAILMGSNIPIYGNGLNTREWIHVKDHAEAIFAVLQHGVPGEIYNIGSGKELTNLELAEMICRLLGVEETRINFVKDRLGHDYRYSIESKKIQSIYSDPLKDFERGLSDTVTWYQKNSGWWR